MAKQTPFTFSTVDLLGNGYSGFAYEKLLIVSATSLIAQAGVAAYDEITYPATFVTTLMLSPTRARNVERYFSTLTPI